MLDKNQEEKMTAIVKEIKLAGNHFQSPPLSFIIRLIKENPDLKDRIWLEALRANTLPAMIFYNFEGLGSFLEKNPAGAEEIKQYFFSYLFNPNSSLEKKTDLQALGVLLEYFPEEKNNVIEHILNETSWFTSLIKSPNNIFKMAKMFPEYKEKINSKFLSLLFSDFSSIKIAIDCHWKLITLITHFPQYEMQIKRSFLHYFLTDINFFKNFF